MKRVDETQPKVCSVCGQHKPPSEFGRASRPRKDGTYCLRAICKECYNKKIVEYKTRLGKGQLNIYRRHCYHKNKEQYLAYGKEWRSRNKEKCYEQCQSWRARNRWAQVLIASRKIAKQRGYTPCVDSPSYIESKFTGFCQNPACRVSEKHCTKKLCLDHDHKTGRFRGWLCNKCNASLGLLGDSQVVLEGLLDYLTHTEDRGE